MGLCHNNTVTSSLVTLHTAHRACSACSTVSLSQQASTPACTESGEHHTRWRPSLIPKSHPSCSRGEKNSSFLHSCKIKSLRNEAVETCFLQLTLLAFHSFSASPPLPSALESRSVLGGGGPVVAAPLAERLGTITALQLHSRTQQPLHSTGKERDMSKLHKTSIAHIDDLLANL